MTSENHILLVDDDREIRALVGAYLERNGLRVSLADGGSQMERVLAQGPVDLVVLDLMMPGLDGMTLCRNLRAKSNIPVLMLTAKSDPIDRILGLEIGADDYVTKPFEPRELLARIRNILKRSCSSSDLHSPDTSYQFSGWTLEARTHQLYSPDGLNVPLSTSEYRLLVIFLTNPNRVLNRDKLMDLLKGREPDVFDRSIDLRISRLRQKLNDDARSPTIIRTLRNEGYLFMSKIEKVAC